MESLDKEYFDLVQRGETLREQLEPYRNRFHAFVTSNETFCYLDLSLAEGREDIATEYSLVLPDKMEDTKGGVMYSMTVHDYDYEQEYSFRIPKDYFADPDKWESDFLETVEKDVSNARNAFIAMFPNMKDELESWRNLSAFNSYAIWADSHDFLIYDMKMSRAEETRPAAFGLSRYFEYEGNLYNPSRMCYQISTGKIILTLSNPSSTFRNESFVLEHLLTTEEARALPRANWNAQGAKAKATPDALPLEVYNQMLEQLRNPKRV